MTSKIGDWGAARRILSNATNRIAKARVKAMKQEAQLFRTKTIEGLRTQSPGGQRLRPLRPSTLAIRRRRGIRGTKALIARGDLRNNIRVVTQDEDAFVGLLRTARNKVGKSLADVGRIHEFGLRRLIRNAFGKGILVRIPARPFLRPVANKFFGNVDKVRDRFNKRLAKLLNGDFGRA